MQAVLATERKDLRDGLQLFLAEAGIAIVGSVTDVRGLLALVKATRPDIVVIDWKLEPGRITRAVKRLRKGYPHLHILVLGSGPEYEGQARAAGADSYLSIGDSPDHLAQALAAIEERAPLDRRVEKTQSPSKQ